MSRIELDITQWWERMTPYALRNISGSAAEHGDGVARITWANALLSARWVAPLTFAQIAEAREHFDSYGAWSTEEIADWPELHLRAMLLQEAAASARLWGLSNLTTRAEWPAADEDALSRSHRLIWDREGPPVVRVAAWGPNGLPSRVVAEFFD